MAENRAQEGAARIRQFLLVAVLLAAACLHYWAMRDVYGAALGEFVGMFFQQPA